MKPEDLTTKNVKLEISEKVLEKLIDFRDRRMPAIGEKWWDDLLVGVEDQATTWWCITDGYSAYFWFAPGIDPDEVSLVANCTASLETLTPTDLTRKAPPLRAITPGRGARFNPHHSEPGDPHECEAIAKNYARVHAEAVEYLLAGDVLAIEEGRTEPSFWLMGATEQGDQYRALLLTRAQSERFHKKEKRRHKREP